MNAEKLNDNDECNIIGNIPLKNDKMLSSDTINEKISGIYKIINKVNGKYYIGSSKNICGKKGRWYKHKLLLNNNKHENQILQRAWNKYGGQNFEFVIIEKLPTNLLLETEQKYLNICNKTISYNISYTAGSPMNGRLHSHTSKEKMKQSHLGIKNHMYGKSHTSLVIEKIKIARHNQVFTKEQINKSILSRMDNEIYRFFNIKTNTPFIGTQYEFRNKIKLNPYYLLSKRRNMYCGWILSPSN